jgi:hypothetical protein
MVETRKQKQNKCQAKPLPPGPLTARGLQGLSEYKYKASGYTVSGACLPGPLKIGWDTFRPWSSSVLHTQILDHIHNPAWNGAGTSAERQQVITCIHADATCQLEYVFLCSLQPSSSCCPCGWHPTSSPLRAPWQLC